MKEYLLLPVAFFLSFLGTWLIIVLSKGRHWLDTPDERSSHTIPTPTAGGVAFVSIFLTASLINFSYIDAGFNHLPVLLMAFFIAVMGLADDIFQLGIAPRIITQLTAIIVVLAIFGVPDFPLFGMNLEPGWPGYILIGLGFLWFINLFNFMDGIDGIAASETLFICLAVTLLVLTESHDSSTNITALLLLLAAVTSGFLLLNFSPAKIFMGDSGSYFLAFILGVSALASTTSGLTNIWVWCILAGIFLVDATYTLIRRINNREVWYYAHRTHAYQRLSIHWQSHGKVVVGLTAINCCWLLPLAWVAHRYPQWGLLFTVLAFIPLLMLVHRLSSTKSSLPGF